MQSLIRLLSVLTLALSACSPADWAAVNAAGSTVGAAVDTFALVRAEQIRTRAAAASEAAARGDTATAMSELNRALATMAVETWAELQELRARCPAPPSSTAPASPTTPALEAP